METLRGEEGQGRAGLSERCGSRQQDGRDPRRSIRALAGPRFPEGRSAPPWERRYRASSGCEHSRDTLALFCSVFTLQCLESAGEERPAPATFGVNAFKQEARASRCPFKALDLPEAVCPSPLPVAPLRKAGFVHLPRPNAAPVRRARARARALPAQCRLVELGLAPAQAAADATPGAPAPARCGPSGKRGLPVLRTRA